MTFATLVITKHEASFLYIEPRTRKSIRRESLKLSFYTILLTNRIKSKNRLKEKIRDLLSKIEKNIGKKDDKFSGYLMYIVRLIGIKYSSALFYSEFWLIMNRFCIH